MKKFIVYDDDGNILSQLQCLESEIADNVPSGYSYQEFDGDPLNKKLVDGELIDLEVEPFVLALTLRDTRNALLSQSDWTQLPDSPLTDSDKIAWQAYRQELRELPETYSDATPIDQVVFPNPPN